MKTVACLIARTNSKRLPEKALIPVAGKLLIEHIIDRLKMVPHIDKIYICTSTEKEDQRLLAIAKKNEVCFYAGSPESPIDRMIQVGKDEQADCLIRVTGDNIFTDPVYLTETIQRHRIAKADYTRMMRVPIGLCAEAMSREALERCYSLMDPDKSEYLMLYMFQPANFSCQVILPEQDLEGTQFSLTVDTPDDFERTRFIFDNLKTSPWVTYPDMLALNRKYSIPHFIYPAEGSIKLPDNSEITFAEFMQDMEARMSRSKLVQLNKGHYESVISHLKP
ncbi:MAG: hypothetical protein WAU91_19000 [Desulfatitalea sp.]